MIRNKVTIYPSLYTFAMALLDHPTIFFPLVALLLFAAGAAGVWLKSTRTDAVSEASDSLKTLENAVLGLLGLLLGFSFAMGVSRYDMRKQLEVEEANAIGTTWLRTETLPEPARSTERQLLKEYVKARVNFSAARTDQDAVKQSLLRTGELQDKLWAVAAAEGVVHRDAVTGLFLATLNETIDDSEKRTASFENRIPTAAWILLIFMALWASGLVGIGMSKRSRPLLIVLPLVIGSAMALILDLDSPRAGFIELRQRSMVRVADQISKADH
jgi:hypothetical protein